MADQLLSIAKHDTLPESYIRLADQLLSIAKHDTLPESYIRLADQLLSIAKHDTLPESYIRPESERPGLAHVITDADVPVVDLGSPDKPQMISQIANACRLSVPRFFPSCEPWRLPEIDASSDGCRTAILLTNTFSIGPLASAGQEIALVHAHLLQNMSMPAGVNIPPRHRAVPEWVSDLPSHGTDGAAFFVASKTIKKSDLDPQQNRFFLPLDSVDTNLVPMLSEAERAAANLVDCGSGKRKRPGQLAAAPTDAPEERIKRPRASKEVGRAHGGLEVTVFMQCGFQCYLKMTRWDGSRGTVIKGNEMKVFRAWSCLKPGDEVEVWAFRMHRGGGLCFAIGRPTSS